MIIALADGLVWAELGAAFPAAGGTYVYLQQAFGPNRWGRLLSFLFLWGAALVMPLIGAFVAVSMAQYASYIWPGMTVTEGKLLAVSACVLATALLYRDIRSVGFLSICIFGLVLVIALWIIITGLWHFKWARAFDFPLNAFSFSASFFSGLGTATLVALLDYGGYGNVCMCGGEVKDPERTIPRSIVYAIVGVAAFYSLTTVTVIGVIPWREAAQSTFVVSDFIARLHGRNAAVVFTMLILVATFGSLFTSLLGFSRVLYAGAADGQFFSLFARLHPQQRFPATSVLAIGGLSSFFCLLPLETLLKGISGVSALTQFIPQVIALVAIRQYRPHLAAPFKMWGYPIPVAIALAGWLFVLLANEGWILLTTAVISLIGVVFYLWRERATLRNAMDA